MASACFLPRLSSSSSSTPFHSPMLYFSNFLYSHSFVILFRYVQPSYFLCFYSTRHFCFIIQLLEIVVGYSLPIVTENLWKHSPLSHLQFPNYCRSQTPDLTSKYCPINLCVSRFDINIQGMNLHLVLN